jgi:hypothetical protein
MPGSSSSPKWIVPGSGSGSDLAELDRDDCDGRPELEQCMKAARGAGYDSGTGLMMKENAGTADRVLRSVAGPALVVIGYRRSGGREGRPAGGVGRGADFATDRNPAALAVATGYSATAARQPVHGALGP